MLSGLLWDNDGVLVDTEGLFYAVNRELFAQHGIALGERHYFDWFLADSCGAWHLLRARGASDADIAVLRAQRKRRYSARLAAEGVAALPGIGALLARIAPHLAMGVVTSASDEHVALIHQHLDLRRHFRFVITAEHYRNSKPDPEPYLLGLQRLGLPAGACLAIEDSPRGLWAARAAGLRCIVLRNRMTAGHAFDGALCVVDDVAQLEREIVALMMEDGAR